MFFFETTLLGISLWRYLSALFFLTASFFAKKIFEKFILVKVRSLLDRTKSQYDQLLLDTVSLPIGAFMLVGGVYVALLTLGGSGTFSDTVISSITASYWVAVTLIVIWAAFRLIDLFNQYLEREVAPKSEVIDGRLIPIIHHGLRIVTFITGLLAILTSLDVDAASLLTGLGIGGLAISLAAQDSLGNFIGSVSLLADRPFKVGDWIITANGKVDGYVEEIGFRSTRVRSWPKTLVTVPNKLLANEIIDNWSEMPKRRVKQFIGVSYQTTPEQMEKLVESIIDMLKNHPGVNQEFMMVRFVDFADSSLQILLYYFTKSVQWVEHLTVKQEVNINLLRLVREAGTSMAFPSRSIYFENGIPGLPNDPTPSITERTIEPGYSEELHL